MVEHVPEEHGVGGSSPPLGTIRELIGFFEAKMRDARSASQGFPPNFPNEFRIFGALARLIFRIPVQNQGKQHGRRFAPPMLPLAFPTKVRFWCSILELVRTHFSEKIPPRKFGKAAEPHC